MFYGTFLVCFVQSIFRSFLLLFCFVCTRNLSYFYFCPFFNCQNVFIMISHRSTYQRVCMFLCVCDCVCVSRHLQLFKYASDAECIIYNQSKSPSTQLFHLIYKYIIYTEAIQ